MNLQFLGQSFSRRSCSVPTQPATRHGSYRGQNVDFTPEATDLPSPRHALTYRGAAYLGR